VAVNGRFERGEQKYEHMLDGDGYVCSFSFNDEGRMHFRSAYVRTRYVACPPCTGRFFCILMAVKYPGKCSPSQ